MQLVEGKCCRKSLGWPVVAGLALLGCAPPDQCERIETLTVAAPEGCPSSDEAGEDQKHLIRAELVDAELDPAVTICWYRADYSSPPPGSVEGSPPECSRSSSRASLRNSRLPYNLSYYILACDEDGLLYGAKVRGPWTLEEAILSTESECPELEEAVELAKHWRDDIVVSEFVGVDFFEPLLLCNYYLVYKCKENRGGGFIDLGGF